jgi:Flp pilus assembly protein TadG
MDTQKDAAAAAARMAVQPPDIRPNDLQIDTRKDAAAVVAARMAVRPPSIKADGHIWTRGWIRGRKWQRLWEQRESKRR